MTIDAGVAAIFITVLLSLMGMAVAWGTLRERVKHNCHDITDDRKANREDHQLLFAKMEEVKEEVKNSANR